MRLRSPVVSLAVLGLVGCGPAESAACDAGDCATGGVIINELAGTGDDFVELFNASDDTVDLSGFGITDADTGGAVRYASSLRFASGTHIEARSYFTIFLEKDCPATVTPCVRAEFGISQDNGDLITLLDSGNATLAQQSYPPAAATSGSSWARQYDGASEFEVQRRSPGATNAP